MRNQYSTAGHWSGPFDEAALQEWASKLRISLTGGEVSLGLVFVAPEHFDHAEAILEVLRVHARIPLLAGCSSPALIAGGQEHEEKPGVVLGLYHLPGAELRAARFTQADVEDCADADDWHASTGVSASASHGWLTFADPFHLDAESWLKAWNQAYPDRPILGGLASGPTGEHRTQVYLNGEVHETGGVAISVGGQVALEGVISQGCTPIGEAWTITKTEQNCIHQIASRPAYAVLAEMFNALSNEDQQKTRGNLFLGLAMNEYREEFGRGDFLIRNLLGADPQGGSIYVGALPRTGQTVQFQRRDAAAATDDMSALLRIAQDRIKGRKLFGGCLCCCNGRGSHLFGRPHHDAGLVQEILGPLGLSGFFCNGEIGPVGNRNYLHGYTAALALFVSANPP